MSTSFYDTYSGVLLLNKPLGISSNAALQSLRHRLEKIKAGHAGTLDPQASGMLVIALGQATKFIQYAISSDKSYRFTIQLGIKTSTGDVEGEPLENHPVPTLNREKIHDVLSHFQGTIIQTPPMFSALKHQGKRLYTLAREGIEITRPKRSVFIHHLHLIAFTQQTLTLDVRCSKGCYIRSLAEDIAVALGSCGYVVKLHRYCVAFYQEKSMQTLEEWVYYLEKKDKAWINHHIYPIDSLLQNYLALQLNHLQAIDLQQGKSIALAKIPDIENIDFSKLTENQPIRLYQKASNYFLGLARITHHTLRPLRLLAYKSDTLKNQRDE